MEAQEPLVPVVALDVKEYKAKMVILVLQDHREKLVGDYHPVKFMLPFMFKPVHSSNLF